MPYDYIELMIEKVGANLLVKEESAKQGKGTKERYKVAGAGCRFQVAWEIMMRVTGLEYGNCIFQVTGYKVAGYKVAWEIMKIVTGSNWEAFSSIS